MEALYPEIVVAGCGNPLYADDGFGIAVVESLQGLELPEKVKVVDAGLGGPHFVFTLLDPESTKKLIIVDIADFGGNPASSGGSPWTSSPWGVTGTPTPGT